MLALAKGDLPLGTRLESHLDRCLTCRACERVCPSNVAYGLALDSVRALIESTRTSVPHPRKSTLRLVQWLVENSVRMRWLVSASWLYQQIGLQSLLRKSGVLKFLRLAELDAAIPKLSVPHSFAAIYPTEGKPRGGVVLFTGCQTNMADQEVLDSSIRLLNRMGYEVNIPAAQGCCGALHLHDGQTMKAAKLMQRNIEALGRENEVILSVATGCTATLKEYGKYLDGNEGAEKFGKRIRDISQFLTEAPWPQQTSWRPLPRRIAVHDPCSLTHVLHQEREPYALLAKIPKAEIIPLPENSICCGAAGAYHLVQSRIAEKLRAPKIEHLKRLAPDILVTSNPSCATFLAAGLREAGINIKVMHPIVLLEKQLQKI